MKFLLFTILLLITTILYSQDTIIENNGVTITVNKKIDTLIKLRCLKKKYLPCLSLLVIIVI